MSEENVVELVRRDDEVELIIDQLLVNGADDFVLVGIGQDHLGNRLIRRLCEMLESNFFCDVTEGAAEDHGWTEERVAALAARNAPESMRVFARYATEVSGQLAALAAAVQIILNPPAQELPLFIREALKTHRIHDPAIEGSHGMARQELYELMSEHSELACSAGWMAGTEHMVWKALGEAGDSVFGAWNFTIAEKMKMADLACAGGGGWWWWPDSSGCQWVAFQRFMEVERASRLEDAILTESLGVDMSGTGDL